MLPPWVFPPLAGLLDRSQGIEQSAATTFDSGGFIALMAIGFVIGAIGHVYKSKVLIALGIALILLVSVGFQLFVGAFK
jgi:CHASE2 domain-containing sensor protein